MKSPYPFNRVIWFWVLAISGFVGDLYSKSAIFAHLGYPEKASPILWQTADGWLTFRLYTSFNPGALWGFGQGFAIVFACLSVIAVIGIVYWLFYRNAATSLWLTIALAFISAGALGNMYDRVGLHGCLHNGEKIFAVRDFLLFTFGHFHWPVFNVADICVVTGSIMLIAQTIFMQPQTQTQTATNERTDNGNPPRTDSRDPSSSQISTKGQAIVSRSSRPLSSPN